MLLAISPQGPLTIQENERMNPLPTELLTEIVTAIFALCKVLAYVVFLGFTLRIVVRYLDHFTRKFNLRRFRKHHD